TLEGQPGQEHAKNNDLLVTIDHTAAQPRPANATRGRSRSRPASRERSRNRVSVSPLSAQSNIREIFSAEQEPTRRPQGPLQATSWRCIRRQFGVSDQCGPVTS